MSLNSVGGRTSATKFAVLVADAHTVFLWLCVPAPVKSHPALPVSLWLAWRASRPPPLLNSSVKLTLVWLFSFLFREDPLPQLAVALSASSFSLLHLHVLLMNSLLGKMKQMRAKTLHMTVKHAARAHTHTQTPAFYFLLPHFKSLLSTLLLFSCLI